MEAGGVNRFISSLILLATLALAAAPPAARADRYVSPYRLAFTLPLDSLTSDFGVSPRSDPHLEGAIPYSEWYLASSYPPYPRHTNRAWGPAARLYPAPTPPAGVDATVWKRERVVAVAQKYIGYAYQHHHIPDFDPGPNWPWLRVRAPGNSKGVDCSDFTSFCYNYGLGLKLDTGIAAQGAQTAVGGLPIQRLPLVASAAGAPSDYATLRKTLVTGDLLYIRNNKGKVAHVVMWLGPIGVSPDGTPLVIDSHGEGVVDSNGRRIPPGIHIRPFRAGSWYHHSFDHANRILQ